MTIGLVHGNPETVAVWDLLAPHLLQAPIRLSPPGYRSAAQPAMAALGAGLEAAAARPGIVLLATEDHFVGTEEQRRRSASRAGAEVARLEGLGHWWLTDDEGRAGAAALGAFWSSLEAAP